LSRKVNLFLSTMLLLLCWHSISFATSIVVVGDKDAVLLAADSKRTLFTAEGIDVNAICKIHVHVQPAFAYASTGNVYVANKEETETYFDVADLIKKIAREARTAREVIETFTKNVVEPLAKSIDMMRNQVPEALPARPGFSTVFVAFENGQLNVYLREFTVRFEQGRILVDVRSTDDSPTADDPLIKWFIGINKEMVAYDATHPEWATRDSVEGIKHLIDLEIKTHPDKVGPPIDIYLLKANGGQWIQRKSTCGNSEQ
jgi:hypothetical protein